MHIRLLATSLLLALVSCNRSEPAAKEKHYPFSGRVVSISLAEQTASIDGAAIPNYMDAMTMDYPIQTKQDLEKLHPGDLISATVNVNEAASYNLSEIKITGHVNKK